MLRGGRHLQWQAIALGSAMFCAVYLFSLNRNVLYLGFLAAGYIVLSALVTRYATMLVGLVFFAFLAMFPGKVPKAKFVEPAEKRENFRGIYSYATPPSSGAWQYEFDVVRLEEHRRECGGTLRGNLVIDGFALDGLKLEAGGRSVDTASPNRFYAGQQLLEPLDEKVSGKVLVALQRKPGTSTWINVGTEAHGSRIYSDAVWLEFRNERCAILYHARRRPVATFPPSR